MIYKARQYISFHFPAARYCGLLLILVLPGIKAAAQKYNFINFNVENGLVQSQVNAFSQDNNNNLLIGTNGGLSLFDGSNFVNYDKNSGIQQSFINSIACDDRWHIWVSTFNAIARSDSRGFHAIPIAGPAKDHFVSRLAIDAGNRVWALINNSLHRYNDTQFVPEAGIDLLRYITLDKSGNLWAIHRDNSISVLHGNTWKQEVPTPGNNMVIRRISFGAYSGTLYCITSQGLYVYENGRLETPEWIDMLPHKGVINELMEDSKGNVWIASAEGGAWQYSMGKMTWFHYQNGFTDDKVNTFFEDREGNVWIGTDGSGIYRYTGSVFTYYDRASGLLTPSVMSIDQDARGNIFLASSISGLYKLSNGIPEKVKMPENALRTYSILYDSLGKLWIGTSQSGLWYYNGREPKLFKPSIEQGMFGINDLYRSGNTLWIAAQQGLFRLKNDSLFSEPVSNIVIYTLCDLNEDTLLLGTFKGVLQYSKSRHKLLPGTLMANSTTLCFAADAFHIYIGTDDKGVIVWDKRDGSSYAIDRRSGLTCNYIYSLLRDRNGNIWAGTGCGIDRITFTDKGFHIRSFGRSDGLLGVENNANASFEDREGFLWFGTTKGVFRYNPYVSAAPQQAPKVVLQSVKLFSKDLPPGKYSDSIMPSSGLQWKPVLPPGQNHLTFTFKGVYLSNPDKIRYRYQLVGIDKNYTETDQTTVVYPNLPPGEYLFKVWASDADGNWYHNAVSYPFTINTPYYTTWYFRLGLGLLAIGLFMGGVYYRNRQKELRRRWEEQLREEEQALVRKKTAEDFHDEIGNKLTRINLLATIAASKLQQPTGDIKHILQQIQDNVSSLYNGAKDIIWSLQPESDYLDEILFRIRQNSADMLQDTHIAFDYQASDTGMHIKLPVDYSRNLIMIFKEAVNNALKHAAAQKITFKVSPVEEDQVLLELKDDGKGFTPGVTGKGNGLGNIGNRAKRIGARLELFSAPGAGTVLQLYISLAKS